MSSIAKYTPAGITARRNLLSSGGKIVLKKFKISDKDIDISGENTVTDLADSWIEKDITSYKKIEDDKILFTLNIKRDEAILEGRSFALYLEDGTPYIVGVPEAVFNRGMEQTYQVLIKVVNNSSGEMELDFEYIHNEDHTATFLSLSNSISNISSSVMSLFSKISSLTEQVIRNEKLNRFSFMSLSNSISNVSSNIMHLFARIQNNKNEMDVAFLTLGIIITNNNLYRLEQREREKSLYAFSLQNATAITIIHKREVNK